MINKSLSNFAPAMRLGVLSSPLLALLFAGCGGGGSDSDEAAQPQASPQSVAPASVRLAGCVVNADWMGAGGTAVHVRTADGRAVGTVFTNPRGDFVITVPARAAVVLDTLVAGPGGIAIDTGTRSMSVGGCLLADL
jgi:hypothetical protein